MAQNASWRDSAREDEDPVDSFLDIPAAVLCAVCGQSDCPGCAAARESESGVIGIVPWERPGGTWTRLWSTASAATQDADSFFAVLPDGEIPAAMRFAVLAELLAVTGMLTVFAPLVLLALPTLPSVLAHDATTRWRLLSAVAVGIPAISLWMVAAHVTHGAALDAGARRQGARSQKRRAVRYGLYACGWDLMAGPLGALWLLGSKGVRDLLEVVEGAARAPGKAQEALLKGVYQLNAAEVTRARRVGRLAAMGIAVVSAAALLATVFLVWAGW